MKRILIVEDEVKILEVVKAYLEREGYMVITTGNGLEVLDIARRINPDLIVLDLMLPGLSGEEVCQKLRSRSDVPILHISMMERMRIRVFDREGNPIFDTFDNRMGQMMHRMGMMEGMPTSLMMDMMGVEGIEKEKDKTFPIIIDKEIVGRLSISYSKTGGIWSQEDIRFRKAINTSLVGAAFVAGLLALGIAILVARKITFPVVA